MANRSDSYSLPPVVQQVATAFRLVGWISFWTQIVLGVVSGVILIFAAGSFGAAASQTTTIGPGGIPTTVPTGAVDPGRGAGLLLAVLGLLALFGGAYWAFRYTRLSRKLRAARPEERLKRGDAIRALRLGLLINLAGMLLTILGAQAIVGSLVAKSFAQGVGIFTGNFQRFINPLDIFLVQANTNTIMGHFVGLLATLWILRSVNRQ
ncbi:DUF3611 family protein [Leptolyngbya sp. NK1-12]|uniref:DUF3611 family protein n=1 Tax=Leptolyngbya sp. NK1-12 TaxID=2547451 RepID=A0AA97AGL6_9CYAN|nr:DUF3611 family protein [Leptolyngbya sp. NK1-12]WNZ24465.1 DUF3611 family protein [Leptolyngbya sp. NK1-12]